MKYFNLFVLALFVLNLALLESADAQQRRRGPRYDRQPPGHRDHRAPRPVPRPVPRPTPGYGYPAPDYGYPTPGYGYPTPGRVTCSASDRGWEEHWGGHSSCGSCLQEHGDCTETCKESTQVCEVQGRDAYGTMVTFTGVGGDRWSAEAEARRSCEWNRNMRSCVTVSCRSQDRTVSTRRCR